MGGEGRKEGRKERRKEEGRGMRLAFDTACQRPEGWSRSRQPDRRIISGIRSKTLLRPATDGEYPGKRGSRHHV